MEKGFHMADKTMWTYSSADVCEIPTMRKQNSGVFVCLFVFSILYNASVENP